MKYPFGGWGMDIFWNHTLPVEIDKCNFHSNLLIPPVIPVNDNQ